MGALQQMLLGAPAPNVYATWDPANTGAAIALSNGNKTATMSGGVYDFTRSTTSKSSGKWYVEITIDNISNLRINEGLVTSAFNGTQSIGFGPSAGVVNYTGGTPPEAYVSSSLIGALTTTPTTGTVIGLAIDLGGLMTVYHNNSAQPNPMTVSGLGEVFLAVGVYGSSGVVSTTNFGASPFVYTPPSGFNPGWYS